jgi:hypothetical protein
MVKEDRDRLLTGNLTYLMALEANGLDCQAGKLVAKIGAALSRSPTAGEASGGPISLPPEERGRSEFDIRRLDQINARLLRGYRPRKDLTVEEQREADLKRRADLEREISARAEEKRRLEAMAEADLLAAARGEEVETDRSGMKRILDRDPIARLTWLTDDQDTAAKAIRDAYEMRAADASAVEYTGMPGAEHNHEHFVARRYERAKATMLVGQVATAILVGTFRSQRGSLILVRAHARFEAEGVIPTISWGMVQAVCGHGLSLTSQGAGRAYDRNRRALALGLDVAHEVLRG